jgi:hypothetical protein
MGSERAYRERAGSNVSSIPWTSALPFELIVSGIGGKKVQDAGSSFSAYYQRDCDRIAAKHRKAETTATCR